MRYAVGLDLGGTAVKAGLVSAHGEMIATLSEPTGNKDPAAVVARLARMTDDVLAAGAARLGMRPALAGIGVGAPGLCRPDGTVLWAPNLAWRDVPLGPLLSARTGQPVRVDNDANVAAWAEAWVGAARDLRHVVLLTLGTGVGGGVIIDGAIYHGGRSLAGELGHMPAGTAGRICSCGKKDCLEAYASATALAERGRELWPTAAGAGLRRLVGSAAAVNARHVTAAAASGDEPAQQLVAEAAAALAFVIGGVINLLNPEAVLLGGGVARAGETLLRPLRQALPAYALPEPLAGCRLGVAALGNKAGFVGAAGLWLREPARGG